MSRRALLAAAAVLSAATSGCAGTLAALGIGLERGKANVVAHEDHGFVYLERDPPRNVDDSGDVVVMLHGFGGSKDHWTRFIGAMPEELTLIAVDLPGFGESPRDPSLDYGYPAQVARLEAFLRAKKVTRFHLLAHSMGGEIAVLYANRHPEQVRSLVLFDPLGLKGPVQSAMDQLTDDGNVPLAIHSAADFDTVMKLSFVKPPDIPDFVKDHFAEQAAIDYPFQQKIKEDIQKSGETLEDAIPLLPAATLVVWGENDQILDPSAIPLWRRYLPQHDVAVMRHTGHAPMLERPAEAAALTLVFWKRAGVL